MAQFRAFIFEDESKEDTYKEWFEWDDNNPKDPTIEDAANELRVNKDLICMVMKIK